MSARKFPDSFIPANPRSDAGSLTESEIVELAWCDFTSFDSIKAQSGLSEAQVIAIMRRHMKPRSFRLWRKRASGRAAKHETRINPSNDRAL